MAKAHKYITVRRAPTFSEIRNRRLKFNLTQTEAAAYIYLKLRMWQFYESNAYRMPKAYWEVFVNKCAMYGKMPKKK
ncbi:MAG: hypothetical protein KAJ19_02525 [Gammaproteobacteria bacterium]|nr:hypothetical protein [Gammaproteobacteria bacterium]